MSASTEILKRHAAMTQSSLHAVVKGRDNGVAWKEVGDVSSASSSGAGFFLARACEVGQLVSLMLPLPIHLRCYDHEKELYRVWGLVQHCYAVSGEGGVGFQVGVAFVGKEAPISYIENSKTSYRISGMNESGLWNITETRAPFKKRQHMRYWTKLDLYLALVDAKQAAVSGERTVTENVSRSGAAVFTTLDINVGDRVKFISEEYDFSGLAVVCNRQTGDDGRERLHVQFVEAVFPVDRLNVTAADVRE